MCAATRGGDQSCRSTGPAARGLREHRQRLIAGTDNAAAGVVRFSFVAPCQWGSSLVSVRCQILATSCQRCTAIERQLLGAMLALVTYEQQALLFGGRDVPVTAAEYGFGINDRHGASH